MSLKIESKLYVIRCNVFIPSKIKYKTNAITLSSFQFICQSHGHVIDHSVAGTVGDLTSYQLGGFREDVIL